MYMLEMTMGLILRFFYGDPMLIYAAYIRKGGHKTFRAKL